MIIHLLFFKPNKLHIGQFLDCTTPIHQIYIDLTCYLRFLFIYDSLATTKITSCQQAKISLVHKNSQQNHLVVSDKQGRYLNASTCLPCYVMFCWILILLVCLFVLFPNTIFLSWIVPWYCSCGCLVNKTTFYKTCLFWVCVCVCTYILL